MHFSRGVYCSEIMIIESTLLLCYFKIYGEFCPHFSYVIILLQSSFYMSIRGPSWSWSYGSWIYTYLCNQCLSPLKLWVRAHSGWDVLDTTLCDKVYQWLATGRLFSSGTPVSSTNKTWNPLQYNWNIIESGVKHNKRHLKLNNCSLVAKPSF